ncbi:MAG: hypothetical protein L3J69_00825 [Desulfobacula sp.]|nr:hypothetical protein [Desulfobacula sp.]
MSSKIDTQYDTNTQAFVQEDYTYFADHGSIESTIISGTGLTENAVTTYTYDFYGTGATYPLRITSETLSGSVAGLLRQIDYSYESVTGNLLTEYAYNDTGGSPVTQYGYDIYGNVTSITDPKGNVTIYEYDSQIDTYATKITRPSTGIYNHISQYPSVDFRYGKPLLFENENGFLTTYTYDVFGRITQIDTPDGGQQTYVYDDVSMPRSTTTGIKDGVSSFIYTYTYCRFLRFST